MPLPFVKPHGEVPLVGQPLTVFGGYVQALFRCNCHQDNQPALILGTVVMECCARCGNVYGITRVSFDRQTGAAVPTVTVGCFGKKPV